MNPRARFLSDISRCFLGPLDGANEFLPDDRDPWEEFQCGVLQSAKSDDDPGPDPEADGELSGGAEDGDEGDDGSVSIGPLSPECRPTSLGISFVIGTEAGETPILDVACTYGLYKWCEEQNGFQRSPHGFLREGLQIEGRPKLHDEEIGPVRFLVRARKLQPFEPTWRVSIFLQNVQPVAREGKRPAESAVFQPEIRVRVLNGALRPMRGWEGNGGDADEESLALLYSDRTPLARGHACSAFWKAPVQSPSMAITDPEILASPEVESLRPESSPFVWIDGIALAGAGAWSGGTVAKYSPADIRSTFLPILQSSAPMAAWDETRYGPSPCLDPSRLAEIGPKRIHAELDPIGDAYGKWIEKMVVTGEGEEVKKRHREDCQRMKCRIEEGIGILAEGGDALLAFGFANKAMALQGSWKAAPGKGPNAWYPFQLAFLLASIRGIVDPAHEDRGKADLLWFPTGGGKTEAYLAVAAFLLGWRRLRDRTKTHGGSGVAVISRYTLRLLTIQQFRRALALVTAMEFLRKNHWHPGWSGPSSGGWGEPTFSIGLWVGGGMTPNSLADGYIRATNTNIPGAISLLRKPGQAGFAEPAQVLTCPCCKTYLAIPATEEFLAPGREFEVHWSKVGGFPRGAVNLEFEAGSPVEVLDAKWLEDRHGRQRSSLKVKMRIHVPGHDAFSMNPDSWFSKKVLPLLQAGVEGRPLALHPLRPGYFRHGRSDFLIECPSPDCALNAIVGGGVIPALTVDEQIYQSPPSVLIGTVDKVAMLPAKQEAGELFGRSSGLPVRPAPELIIQDELHLIEGPLGSLVGLYETAIDLLCDHPKYIASTATVRAASPQVKCLMGRELKVFPPPGLRAGDSFFAVTPERHPLDDSGAGRVFLGLFAPGRGALTPTRNLYACLLQTGENLRWKGIDSSNLDPFWTVIGYFNALRELAGVKAMLDQDIPQRLEMLAPEGRRRVLDPDRILELSSRLDAADLPQVLESLGNELGRGNDPADVVLATSMFGTGVDVDRLGTMVIQGMPKTMGSYIQAAGRVGRRSSGLVATMFRASRPRDLDHFEFFVGIHGALYRHVEPVTLHPYSERALEIGLGPVVVALLRNLTPAGGPGMLPMDANSIRQLDPGVQAALCRLIEVRASGQAENRTPAPGIVTNEILALLDRWKHLADGTLEYVHYGAGPLPPVVLGTDAYHANPEVVVLEQVPTSLRGVESTASFQRRRRISGANR